MQLLFKWIITAILDWTIGLIFKIGSAMLDYFKKREVSEKLDGELEKETDPKKREDISDEILNGKP